RAGPFCSRRGGRRRRVGGCPGATRLGERAQASPPGPVARGRAAPNTHADSGGPAPRNRAAVPGTVPRPVPILIGSQRRGHSRVRRAHLPREGPVRPGSRSGRGVRRFLLLRGAAVGGGGILGGCFGTEPVNLGQLRLSPFQVPRPTSAALP